MTGEAWLLIAAGLAVGGVCAALIGAIGWHNGYAAAMRKVTARHERQVADFKALFPPHHQRALFIPHADGSYDIEHFPAGWPDKTVMN